MNMIKVIIEITYMIVYRPSHFVSIACDSLKLFT
jgi:hypothetical protein